MSKLLNANFSRLFKGKIFYICAAAAFVFGLIETLLNKAIMVINDLIVPPEGALFKNSGAFFLVLTAVFVGIFVGAEHEGALRNKVIVGQKRSAILLAYSITCSAAIAMIHLLFIATVLISGLIRGGEFLLSFGEIAICELLQLASLVEMCVLFSVIALLRSQKYSGAIISLVLVFGFLALNTIISSFLSPLKYSYESIYADIPMYQVEEENISSNEQIKIAVYEGIQDITPLGQQEQIKKSYYNAFYSKNELIIKDGYTKVPIPVEIAPFALGAIAATTAVGVLVFRKKDIK